MKKLFAALVLSGLAGPALAATYSPGFVRLVVFDVRDQQWRRGWRA